MVDDRRRFALRENGEETSVFTGKAPRQAALKAARRLDPAEGEQDAIAASERIRLREHGTVDIHIYEAWAWEEETPDDGPAWLNDTVTKAKVNKMAVERTTKSEIELEYDQLEPFLVDQPIAVTRSECSECGHQLDNSYYSSTRVRDVPSITGTIEYTRYGYKCTSCGTKNQGEHPYCSSVSGFGTNAIAQAVLFYYEYRLSYRDVSNVFNQLYNFDISPASVQHICDYLFTAAQSEYESVCEEIQTSDVIHIDETQFPVDGDDYWLWGFTTDNETLYALRDSRGSVVLEEILGDEFDGIIVCDGWTVYSAYHSRLQRCWAHLLREKENISGEDAEAQLLYEELQKVHDGLNRFLKTSPSPLQRIIVQHEARRRLETLVAEGAESNKACEALQTIEGGLGDWLTFVVHPGVDSTNNRAERILRDSVMRRKTMMLRKQKGVNSYEIFQSLIQTWKQQEQNPYTELQRLAQEIGKSHTNAKDAWD